MDKNRIEKALARVIHPVKDKDLITLEMIEDIKIEEGRVGLNLFFLRLIRWHHLLKRAAKR